MLNPELLKVFADKVLDFAEDYVLGSKSELDDKIVLPICSMIRITFGIPDDDEDMPDEVAKDPVYVDEEQPEGMNDK
jgi:hypothetical protein